MVEFARHLLASKSGVSVRQLANSLADNLGKKLANNLETHKLPLNIMTYKTAWSRATSKVINNFIFFCISKTWDCLPPLLLFQKKTFVGHLKHGRCFCHANGYEISNEPC